MKVLVIYEIIPDETLKTIVEMTQEEYNYFKQVNDIIVNVSDMSDVQSEVAHTINCAFSNNENNNEICETEKQKCYFGKWKNTEIEDISEVQRLILLGFYI